MLRRIRRGAVHQAASAIDRAANLAAFASASRARKKSRAETLSHSERLEALEQITDRYRELGAEPDSYFPEARPIDPVRRRVRSLDGGGSVEDLSWQSEYEPYLPELEERYARYPSNQVAATRFFFHEQPRPVMILIHGYLGGQYLAEERVWPVQWLYKKGLDVALFVLPFHAVRGEPERRGPPPFPGADPRMSNEGFRQAIGDLRSLVGWLRDRGHPEVGVMGMSLGGYTTSLLATIERELAFAIPVIPLGSLADFAREQGRLGKGGSEELQQHAALDRVHRLVSPLHREPQLPPERVLVIGAEADRITPIAHARRLASHFRAPMETWPGGHLLQLGRSRSFRRIGRYIVELGIVEPRPGE